MSKIKKDKHGLYVICNGAIHRPETTPWDHNPLRPKASEFQEGVDVKASHISQSPFSKVVCGEKTEVWVSHGSRYDQTGRILSSKQVFCS